MLSKSLAYSLAFLLLSAPQASGLAPDTTIVQGVVQGGVAAILVWIWWKTHTQANREQKAMRETIDQAFRATRENARENRQELREALQSHHETQKQLVGVMTRLETKLDQLED